MSNRFRLAHPLRDLTTALFAVLLAPLLVGCGATIATGQEPPNQVLCPVTPDANASCTFYEGGNYDRTQFELLSALRLRSREVALYRNYAGEIELVEGAGMHPVPARDVVMYPIGIITYKTERDNQDPVKCPPNDQSVICDTPIDNIVFGDNIAGTIDIAISFQFEFNSDNNPALYELGGVNGLINLLTQEVRNYRALMSVVDPETAPSAEGHRAIRGVIEDGLAAWSFSELLDIQSVQIRSITINDEAFNSIRITQQAVQNQSRIAERERELAATQAVYDREIQQTQAAFDLGSQQTEQAFEREIQQTEQANNQQVQQTQAAFELEQQALQREIQQTEQANNQQMQQTQAAFELEQQATQGALAAQREAERQALLRDQRREDALAFAEGIEALCDNVTPDDCVNLVWVYTFGAQYNPVLGNDGNLSVFPVSPFVATPSPVPTVLP